MKFLHRILLIGVLLLTSILSYGQEKLNDSKQPISIVNASIAASAVFEFNFSSPTDIELKVYDKQEVIVQTNSWKDVESTFTKFDFSLLKNGTYMTRFYDQGKLIYEKEVTKI
jgi:hypothetical protein